MRLITILAVRRNSPVKVETWTVRMALLPWNCCPDHEQFISLLLDILLTQPWLSSVFEPHHLAWAFFIHVLHSTAVWSGVLLAWSCLLSPLGTPCVVKALWVPSHMLWAQVPCPSSSVTRAGGQCGWQSCGSHMNWWKGMTQVHFIVKCGCLRLGKKGQEEEKALGCNFWNSKSRCLWTALFSFFPTPWTALSTSFQRPTSSCSDTSLESSIILSRILEWIRWMPLTWPFA